MDIDTQALQTVIKQHPYPLLFTTLTGSHAFGCASEDSDYDVHGCHLVPVVNLLEITLPGETYPQKTVERKWPHPQDGKDVDLATHELEKFLLLMLKSNGNVLEDLYSPYVITTSETHEEIKELGKGCLSKLCAAHFRGMAYNQQKRMQANEIKKYIHLYRCLLMGIHLMRSQRLHMNLPDLAREYHQAQVLDLVAAKHTGIQQVEERDVEHHEQCIEMLKERLERETEESQLPDRPTKETRNGLNSLLLRVRLGKHVGELRTLAFMNTF